MLELIDYDNIRRLAQDGWSIRRIAKYLKHSRESVRKALEWDGSKPRYRLSKPRQRTKATPEIVEAVQLVLKIRLIANLRNIIPGRSSLEARANRPRFL